MSWGVPNIGWNKHRHEIHLKPAGPGCVSNVLVSVVGEAQENVACDRAVTGIQSQFTPFNTKTSFSCWEISRQYQAYTKPYTQQQHPLVHLPVSPQGIYGSEAWNLPPPEDFISAFSNQLRTSLTWQTKKHAAFRLFQKKKKSNAAAILTFEMKGLDSRFTVPANWHAVYRLVRLIIWTIVWSVGWC